MVTAQTAVERAISLDGPIRETFLTTFRDILDADQWLTEIGGADFSTPAPSPA